MYLNINNLNYQQIHTLNFYHLDKIKKMRQLAIHQISIKYFCNRFPDRKHIVLKMQ